MIDPFKKISDEDRKKLLKNLEAQTFHFDKNVPILSSIRTEHLLGIVLEGCVQIIKTDYDGNRTITEELTENAVFGSKISFLTDNECEMLTKEETTLIILDYYGIINYIQNGSEYYNQFILNLLEISMGIIAERNERIKILTKKTIRNRLLEYFKISSQKTGSKNIYLPFSFTDLADYLATDRSAMSREMKNLKDEGFISVKGRKITLHYNVQASVRKKYQA